MKVSIEEINKEQDEEIIIRCHEAGDGQRNRFATFFSCSGENDKRFNTEKCR